VQKEEVTERKEVSLPRRINTDEIALTITTWRQVTTARSSLDFHWSKTYHKPLVSRAKLLSKLKVQTAINNKHKHVLKVIT